jgi:hypothetical protein
VCADGGGSCGGGHVGRDLSARSCSILAQQL